MKKEFFILPFIAAAIVGKVYSQDAVHQLEQIDITSLRVPDNTPFATANVQTKQIKQFSHTGKELPFLFARTPGITAWSENGIGQGAANMRIRGTSGERINVTLDGVPLNSPEDQCVFWANMNSYPYMLKDIQIQRGVGSSTNGTGAFGGNIAMDSKIASEIPFIEINGSFGSYNTANFGGSFSTGILWDKVILDASFHHTRTDGFLNGTGGYSGSYYGSVTIPMETVRIRYRHIGNYERMGQAWNGVTAGNDNLSIMDGTYGAETGIRTYQDMYNAGLGRFNSLYQKLDFDQESYSFNKDSDRKYTTSRYTLSDGGLWEKATDNFWQNHNLLSFDYDISPDLKMSTTLFYTYGYGYYNDFKENAKLSKFGIQSIATGPGQNTRADFIRKKGVDQNNSGLVHRISYMKNRWSINGGISLQYFSSYHFGDLTYMSIPELVAQYMPNGNSYRYYESNGNKADNNIFVKANYTAGSHFNIFADLQYRMVYHRIDGENDIFIEQDYGNCQVQLLDIEKWYHFFNPKAGFSYINNCHKAYLSVAASNREPVRNNFTDNGSHPLPESEHLTDIEAGYDFSKERIQTGANLYYMKYRNQLVQTGEISNIGEALTTNVKDSYRAGIELTAMYRISNWISLSGNAAFSINRISDFDQVVEDWDNSETGYQTVRYSNTDLPYSPGVILNGFADLTFGPVCVSWHTGYVGRQYLDNTSCIERSLPAYTFSNLEAYITVVPKKQSAIKVINAGFDVNNVFNSHYAANGWVYSAICNSAGHGNSNRYYQIGFMPASGITIMGHLTLDF